MDPITLTSFIMSISALLTGIFTHIKHSKCLGVEIDTYNPTTPLKTSSAKKVEA